MQDQFSMFRAFVMIFIAIGVILVGVQMYALQNAECPAGQIPHMYAFRKYTCIPTNQAIILRTQ